jgi:hypothetical protein
VEFGVASVRQHHLVEEVQVDGAPAAPRPARAQLPRVAAPPRAAAVEQQQVVLEDGAVLQPRRR